ncbi:MAG: hypothetical protein A3K23_04765 [Desulfobacca sp. RBG_16_58_9]|nr:MAG: hypothetical protein A3K23_04765 [Desulfobacca sp. RBG_16_58_9]
MVEYFEGSGQEPTGPCLPLNARAISSLFFHETGQVTEPGQAFIARAWGEQVWARRKTNGNGGVSPLIRSDVE